MGTGRRDGNRLNFQITANFNMSNQDAFRWRCAFFKGSELLYNSTQGQLSFGDIYVSNDSAGINNAEFILDNSGGAAFASSGGFGDPGLSITCPPYIQEQVLSLVHELGHHLWNLKEEYAFTSAQLVDDGATLPSGHGNLVIPLQDATGDRPDADYAGADARVFFDTGLETQTIVSKVGDRVTVDAAFSQDPRDASNPWILFQWEAECTGDPSTGACIMQFSRSAAGTMDANCNWTPAANPVTEFCTSDNHDPDMDTDQHDEHGEACWATIGDHPDFSDLTVPTGVAGTTMPGGYVEPNWIVLEPNPRFALILDRSGSMNRNGGARLEGVKTGAAYWLENAAIESDFLTIVWYNTSTTTALNLTDFSTLDATDIETLVNAVDAQTATGGTNIRDALLEGLDELTSPGTAAAVQASLMITDGAHNDPPFTSMLEAVPDYQLANTNIYTLGVGSGAEVDIAGLEDLAQQTGGSSFSEDDGADAFEIQSRMTEINNLIRGGLVSTLAEIMPDARESNDFQFDSGTPPQKRPSMKELLDKADAKTPLDLLKSKKVGNGRVFIAHHHVENGAQSATFNLAFEKPLKLWLYLVSPNGDFVDATTGGVIFVSSDHQFEFAKVEKPKPGTWTIVGFRPENGAAGRAQAITGIQHEQLAVTARAWSRGDSCPVKVKANARFGRPITGYSAKATVSNMEGERWSIRLHDDDGYGAYKGYFDLPPGLYRGYVNISASENIQMAGAAHAMVHAEKEDKIGNGVVKSPKFQRSIPISFVVGTLKEPKPSREDEEGKPPRKPRFQLKSAPQD